MISWKAFAMVVLFAISTPWSARAQSKDDIDPNTMSEMQAYQTLKSMPSISMQELKGKGVVSIEEAAADSRVHVDLDNLNFAGGAVKTILPPPEGDQFPYKPIQFDCVTDPTYLQVYFVTAKYLPNKQYFDVNATLTDLGFCTYALQHAQNLN